MSQLKKLSFTLMFLVVPLPFIGFYLGGFYNFLPALLLFGLIPLFDWFLQDKANLDSDQELLCKQDPYFKWLLWIYVPIEMIALIFAIYLVSQYSLTWYELLGFSLAFGVLSGGIGITLAHELVHKNTKLDQLLSKALLGVVCYGHFCIEHVMGHHVNVATPGDPATARLGESFYQYLPRTLVDSFKSAFRLEKRRLIHKNYSVYSFKNQFWWIISVPLLIVGACWFYGGWVAVVFFLLQSLFAIVLLELVNYIEHYGLERKKLENGRYEKITMYHSWNSCHWLSNVLLIHLQRHSEHHMFGARPYQLLKHYEPSPQLPSGYAGMALLALVPPLWRAVMDKRALYYRSLRRVED